MRVIPVLDLLAGHAVHARAGRRDDYAPVSSRLIPHDPGDALALARAYRDSLGFHELYVADLDAITGAVPARALRRALAAASDDVRLWVDAGIVSPSQALEVLDDGASSVVVALETLPASPAPRDALESIVAAAGAAHVAFSLDLRDGEPLARAAELAALNPVAIAELAVLAGVRTLILLDLARVGTATGVDLTLVRQLRRHFPDIELIAGGGIRGPRDIEDLSEAGADAALVASALL